MLSLGAAPFALARDESLVAGSIPHLAADQPYVEAHVSGSASDNVRRTTGNEIDDTITAVGFSLDTSRDGTRLDYVVAGDVAWLHYIDDSFKDQLTGFLDGSATLELAPERFNWTFRENFNRLLVDPAAAATPDNLAKFSYFTTGPQLVFRFDSATQLVLFATYSDVSSQDEPLSNATSNLDRQRYGGGLALSRAVSDAAKLSLSASTESVEYDSIFSADYDRDEASLTYALDLARTAFSADLGASRIRLGGSSDGLLARIGLTRRISPSSTIALGVSRQTADSTDIIRSGFGPQRPSDAPLRIAARDPLVERGVSLSWQYAKARTRLGLDAYRSQERYLVSTALDRTMEGGGAYIERRLRPTLSIILAVRYEHQQLDRVTADNDDLDASASINWYAGPHLKVTLKGERYDRSGTGASLDYLENRIGLQFAYGLLGTRR